MGWRYFKASFQIDALNTVLWLAEILKVKIWLDHIIEYQFENTSNQVAVFFLLLSVLKYVLEFLQFSNYRGGH